MGAQNFKFASEFPQWEFPAPNIVFWGKIPTRRKFSERLNFRGAGDNGPHIAHPDMGATTSEEWSQASV